MVNLAVGLDLTLVVVACQHRPALDDPLPDRGLTWSVDLVPVGTPTDRLDPPVRDSVEAAVAHCLRHLDLAIAVAVPVDPATPIAVPQLPTPVAVADPVPLIARLTAHYDGEVVAVSFSRAGCVVRSSGSDGWTTIASAATLADAARTLGLRPA
jgi:hypothetical protein